MHIALKCSKCGHYHTEQEEATLVVDFAEGKMFFICMIKGCRHENVMDLRSWQEQAKNQPLPKMRLL